MGRTIGAAIGAVIVMLFFATVKTHGRNPTSSTPVSTAAQNRAVAKPVADLPVTPRPAH
jgi:hypothetical protein